MRCRKAHKAGKNDEAQSHARQYFASLHAMEEIVNERIQMLKSLFEGFAVWRLNKFDDIAVTHEKHGGMFNSCLDRSFP